MKLKLITLSLLAISLVSSCKKKDEDTTEQTPVTTNDDSATKKLVVKNYADIVYYSYLDAYETAKKLQTSVDNFVASPSENGLKECKDKWLAAREPYGQTEVYRFYDGPVDGIFNGEEGPEGLMNSWPLDELHIDYAPGVTNANAKNLVNDVNFTLTKSNLLDQNGVGGDEALVSVGYHAIEFLLWGQDNTAPSALKPGQRPYTDYVTGSGGTASNQTRRGEYLKLCAAILVDNLKEMVDAWAPSTSGNYRASFESKTDESLKKMIAGMGFLSKGELAGERINVALEAGSQEDEHSCFSDNTHRDIFTNAQGIRNVYLGCYERVDGQKIIGASLSDLVKTANAKVDEDMKTKLNETMKSISAVPAPFDNALTANKAELRTVVNNLGAQAVQIQSVSTALGLGNVVIED